MVKRGEMSLAEQPAPGCRSLYSTRVDVGEQMETLIGRLMDAHRTPEGRSQDAGGTLTGRWGTLTGRPRDAHRKLSGRPGPGGQS